jgi:hypothetical protein
LLSSLSGGMQKRRLSRIARDPRARRAGRQRAALRPLALFDVLAEGIQTVRDKTIGLLEKLQAAFHDGVDTLMRVLDDPITFAANFLAGIAQGVQGFAANIGKHLKAGLIEWLTGSLARAGVTLPTSLDVKGIVGFILQLLGLTIDNVKARARVIWGEKIVRASKNARRKARSLDAPGASSPFFFS